MDSFTAFAFFHKSFCHRVFPHLKEGENATVYIWAPAGYFWVKKVPSYSNMLGIFVASYKHHHHHHHVR